MVDERSFVGQAAKLHCIAAGQCLHLGREGEPAVSGKNGLAHWPLTYPAESDKRSQAQWKNSHVL